jgi:histidyl-tRNA synthetase
VGEEGIRELTMIQETLAAYEVPVSCYRFDLTLARGLDYYTGPIFETIVTEPKIGSITGGGRYDNLIGLFTRQPVPATGTSFGLERIITVMEELGGNQSQAATAQVLVTLFDRNLTQKNIKIAKMLREAGIRTELYFSPDKLKKQLAYAAGRAIPRVLILGSDEDRDGTITLRNMRDGAQEILPQSGLAAAIKKSLALP